MGFDPFSLKEIQLFAEKENDSSAGFKLSHALIFQYPKDMIFLDQLQSPKTQSRTVLSIYFHKVILGPNMLMLQPLQSQVQ